MMTSDHWNAFKLFLSAKANERRLQEGPAIMEMIPEFWDILQDEVALQDTVEALELSQIKTAIPRQEESLTKLRERQAELEAKAAGPPRVT